MQNDSFSKILKSAGIIMICTVVFKILGFIKDLLLTYYFGTTGISDAFLISLTIPGTLFEFVGTGLTACFIPVYYSIIKEYGQSKANEFTNKITTIILSFATFLVLVVWLDTNIFVKIFASGFKASTLSLACKFTRISIISLYFSTLVYVFTSYLQANKKFFPPAITAVEQNAIVLVAIIIGAKINLMLMSTVFALSIASRLLYLYPSVKKLGLNLKLNFKWRDSHIKKLCLLLLPVALGSTVNDLNVIVDRTLASQIAVGAISALTYGNSLIQFANGGLIQPIATVYFPYITEHISLGNNSKAADMLNKTLSLSLLIFIPLCIIFLVYSKAIIHFVFERGEFQQHALNLTSSAFYYYSLGLAFIAVREFLSRFYYAYGDTKTPMINAIIGVLLNILFNIVFSRFMGIGGLAFATSLSAAITSILLIVRAHRKLGVSYKQMFSSRDLVKIGLAGILLYVLNRGCVYFLGDESLLTDISTITITMIIYLYTCCILKVKSVSLIENWVKEKLSKTHSRI